MSNSDVQELRARIEKVSTEIALQKEVLKKLERDKSLLQRRLNVVLDPVARLPPEISSKIFLQTLPPFPVLDAEHLPLLLLRICHAWTDIVLPTPALWAAIYVEYPYAEGLEKVLKMWVQRAGNRLLSVSLRGTPKQRIRAAVWKYCQQLKHLEISCDQEEENDEGDDEDGSAEGNDEENEINLLGGPEPLPSLETLAIRSLGWMQKFSGPQILKTLRLTPNLVECVFDGMHPVSPVGNPAAKLVLPSLRRLIFGGGSNFAPDNDEGILKCLSLPALEALSLPVRNVSGDDLLAFLKRSLPPLRELVLGNGVDGISWPKMHECLQLVPTLTRLEMWAPGSRLVEELFVALADSPSFLPNLHTLTTYVFSLFTISHSTWETLLRAVSSRRQMLEIVHLRLKVGDTVSFKPTAEILAAFREEVVDGRQVYIGDEKSNFVSV
ncbi:hypothetical protein B0H19DRAFT_132493 [Mycena capillaripes]|nr:hypothetical protein B0H19DRAFT_132493 [Mycena capillaripes]